MNVAGEGFEAELVGTTLTIRVDVSREGVPSSSGKSLVIASSRGSVKIGELSINLNVYKKRVDRTQQ